MTDTKTIENGSVLSNRDVASETKRQRAPSASSSTRNASSSDDGQAQAGGSLKREAGEDTSRASKGGAKDPEPEAKKRKRSQRACVRCRGQKLKCDGVFPCARCLKLKLVCREPVDPNTSSSSVGHAAVSKDGDGMPSNGASPMTKESPRHVHANRGFYDTTNISSSISSQTRAVRGPSGPSGPLPGLYGQAASTSYRTRSPSLNGFSHTETARRIERLEASVRRLARQVEGPGAEDILISSYPESTRASGLPSLSITSSKGHIRADILPHDRQGSTLNLHDESELEVDELAPDGHSEADGDHRFPHPGAQALYMLSKAAKPPNDRERRLSGSISQTYTQDAPPKYDPTRDRLTTNIPSTDSKVIDAHRMISILPDPVAAGLVEPAQVDELINFFMDVCHPYLPVFQSGGLPRGQVEPFLLSSILAVAASRERGTGMTKDRSRSGSLTSDLSTLAQAHLAQSLTRSRHSVADVQATLLLQSWGIGSGDDAPDARLLWPHALAIGQKLRLDRIARRPLSPADEDARRTWILLCLGKLLPFPTSPRHGSAQWHLEACTESVLSMQDTDRALGKHPGQEVFLVVQSELAQISKQLSDWVSDISSGKRGSPSHISRLQDRTMIWERFKAIESQLYLCQERWESAGLLRSWKQITSVANNRWHLQLCASVLALWLNDLDKSNESAKASNGDRRLDQEEAHRFFVAYYRSARQAAQYLIELYSASHAASDLAYQPDHLARALAQAVIVLINLISADDGACDRDRISMDLIHLGMDRLGQVDARGCTGSPGRFHLLSRVVRDAYGSKLQRRTGAESEKSASHAGSIDEKRPVLHSPVSSSIQPAYPLQMREASSAVGHYRKDSDRLSPRKEEGYGRLHVPDSTLVTGNASSDEAWDIENPVRLLFGTQVAEDLEWITNP